MGSLRTGHAITSGPSATRSRSGLGERLWAGDLAGRSPLRQPPWLISGRVPTTRLTPRNAPPRCRQRSNLQVLPNQRRIQAPLSYPYLEAAPMELLGSC